MKTFGTVAGLANFCVFSVWWFYANIGRYKKAHDQVSMPAVISIPKNYLTPCIYAALQSAREGLCYEPFAPCASTFLLRSFTHGVCHLQDAVHLAVREF